MEQLRDNFEIEIAEPKEKFTRIIGDEQFTYDRAVSTIIQKLKELGYLKLILAYRPLPYVNIHDMKYTAVVCVVEGGRKKDDSFKDFSKFATSKFGNYKEEKREVIEELDDLKRINPLAFGLKRQFGSLGRPYGMALG